MLSISEFGTQQKLQPPTRITSQSLKRAIFELESEHRMTTEEFVGLWRSGELPEAEPYIEWAHLSKLRAFVR